MPTSNETRVLVEGFWKIIPSVRPGRSWCASRALEALELDRQVEQLEELLIAPVRDAGERAALQAVGDGGHGCEGAVLLRYS
jgi:hypothetical protein